MPDHGNGIPSSSPLFFHIDLTQVTESTRRELYDAVVIIHFRPTPAEVQKAAEDPENHWVPTYDPDEARLEILHWRGRWFATWKALEEGDAAPEHRRWVVLRIGKEEGGGGAAGGLAFYEV